MNDGWQPIETAPKKGRILVWNKYFGVYSSEYVEEYDDSNAARSKCKVTWSGYPLGVAGGELGKWYCVPTLWRPLPPHPSQEEANKHEYHAIPSC